jgi:hypothetical protein
MKTDTKYNSNDLIVNELNEAIDINSSKKTIAYKYFKGSLIELEKYLDQKLYSKSDISVSIPSRQLELFS